MTRRRQWWIGGAVVVLTVLLLVSLHTYSTTNTHYHVLPHPHTPPTTTHRLTDTNGYVALLYTGTARSFSQCFESHLVNLITASPYTVHLYIHTYTNDNKFNLAADSLWSNYRTINTTLRYYAGYMDLYGQYVRTSDMLKGYTEEYLPTDILQQRFATELSLARASYPNGPNNDIISMWNSQRAADDMRRQYELDNGMEYTWVFRVRFDSMLFSNWWQQAFTIVPLDMQNTTHQLYAHPTYTGTLAQQPVVISDMVYYPRLRADQLYVPNCRPWWGFNDQFAASNSTIATIYNQRIRSIQRMHDEGWVHPESSVQLVMMWSNITVSFDGNICYTIVRVSGSEQWPAEREYDVARQQSLVDHSHTQCEYKFAESDCCDQLCGARQLQLESLQQHILRHIDTAAPVDNYMQPPDIQLYVDSVCGSTLDCPATYDSSNYYYYYRTVNSVYHQPCLPSTWPADTTNPYRFQYTPFIHVSIDSQVQTQYWQHLTCQV